MTNGTHKEKFHLDNKKHSGNIIGMFFLNYLKFMFWSACPAATHKQVMITPMIAPHTHPIKNSI